MFPEDQRIVFTGRLASMSRQEAIVRVVARGGVVCTKVSRRTDVLVIGSDGWPLRRSGKLTRHLNNAEKLYRSGFPVDVISEQEFLKRLRRDRTSNSVRRTHTLEQLSRLLGVSGLRLRRWLDRGLIEPIETRDGVALFDFQQVNAARTIARLHHQGVPIESLVKNLRRLKRWLPGDTVVARCLIQLEKELVVLDASGRMIEPSGQLLLPLDDELSDDTTIGFAEPEDVDPDALFDHAFELEIAGHLDEAIDVYKRWLSLFGDDVETMFNLGNTYLAIEQCSSAVACYRRCLKLDKLHGPAWNNLGLCLGELGQPEQAHESLQVASCLMPECEDTIANLRSLRND